MAAQADTVRNVVLSDLPKLLPMVHALAAHHGDPAITSLAQLERDLLGSTPWLRSLVAEHAGQIIGYAAMCPRAQLQEGTRGLDIHHLYVDPNHRGTGFGRSLVDGCIDTARGLSCDYILVSTVPDNHSAQAMYRACGFTPKPNKPWSFSIQLSPHR